MKKKSLLIYILVIFNQINSMNQQPSIIANSNNADAQWLIIGAGPAGICVVGLLLELGVAPKTITWIDQKFNVGRLGESYTNVPSNTQTKYFIEFINCCKTFKEAQSPAIANLSIYNPELEYPLQIIVEPLRDITTYMCNKVVAIKDSLQSLDFHNDLWHVGINNRIITAYNVVLATGSHPKSLSYEGVSQISLDIALDKTLLAEYIEPQDSIAVVGSAHSAILILKYLSELSVKRIINFYNKPLQYAIDNPSGLVYENEGGLKGIAARWALEVLESNPPANLIRIFNRPQALDAWLPICNKIIYAIGFERNELPPLNGNQQAYNSYDGSSGIIAQRLFGIGIAFPEKFCDINGNQQLGIGLNDFLEYAQRVMPLWLTRNNNNPLLKFKNLFFITSL